MQSEIVPFQVVGAGTVRAWHEKTVQGGGYVHPLHSPVAQTWLGTMWSLYAQHARPIVPPSQIEGVGAKPDSSNSR